MDIVAEEGAVVHLAFRHTATVDVSVLDPVNVRVRFGRIFVQQPVSANTQMRVVSLSKLSLAIDITLISMARVSMGRRTTHSSMVP